MTRIAFDLAVLAVEEDRSGGPKSLKRLEQLAVLGPSWR